MQKLKVVPPNPSKFIIWRAVVVQTCSFAACFINFYHAAAGCFVRMRLQKALTLHAGNGYNTI